MTTPWHETKKTTKKKPTVYKKRHTKSQDCVTRTQQKPGMISCRKVDR